MPTQINSNDVAGATSGLLNLIRMISGKDKITGGPVMDANGNITVAPYQGSTGFLGAASRRQARVANNQMLPEIYKQQLANKGQIDVEQARAYAEAVKQLLANEGMLSNTRLGNEGSLQLAKTKARQDRRNEKQRSRNSISETNAKADADVRSKQGITTASSQAYDESVSPQLVNNLARRAQLETGSLNSPDAQKAYNMNILATLAKPGVDNQVASRITLPLNSAVGLTDMYGGTLGSIMSGNTEQQNVALSGGVPDPKTGRMVGGELKTFTTIKPPSKIGYEVPSQFLEEARSIGNNPATQSQQISKFPTLRVSPFSEAATNVPTDGSISLLSNSSRFQKPQQVQQVGGLDSLLDSSASGLMKLINALNKYSAMANDPSLRTYNRVTDL